MRLHKLGDGKDLECSSSIPQGVPDPLVGHGKMVPIGRDPSGKFLPGVSGNPAGGVPRRTFAKVLRTITSDEELANIARKLKMMAISGDLKAMTEFIDRIDGKAVQGFWELDENQLRLMWPETEIVSDDNHSNSATVTSGSGNGGEQRGEIPRTGLR